VFKIFDKKGEMSVRMASFVNFPYHPVLPYPNQSRARHVPTRPRSVLDAVHIKPAVQVKAPALSKASGMHYWTPDGRKILDAVAGLWCVNAGHGRREITEAVSSQLETMDYAPPFQMGHPAAFELANQLVKITPPGLDHVFFTNSGSESVDTALKIALAYHRARGEATRTRLIGRERGYHGVGFGGISVAESCPTGRCGPTQCCPASITSLTPTTWRRTHSHVGSPLTACIWLKS